MKKKLVIIIGSVIALLIRIESLWALIILIFGNKDINKMDYPTSYWIGNIITVVVIFCCVYWVLWKLEEYKRKIMILKKFNFKRIDNLIDSLKTNLKQNFNEHDNILKNFKNKFPEIDYEIGKDERINILWDSIQKDFKELEEKYNKEFKNWEE